MIRKWIFRPAIAGIVFAALAAVAAFFFPQKILCVDSGNVSAEAIVVLGGGAPERSERAAELFRQHVAPRIIVSGAGDGEINRQILIQSGIPASVIEMEADSKTTRENAQFTVRRLRAEKIRSAIIVTSWYHSRRALKTFGHFAPEIKFYARPSYFAFARKDWPRHFYKRVYLEYAKLPGYWVRYGVFPF